MNTLEVAGGKIVSFWRRLSKSSISQPGRHLSGVPVSCSAKRKKRKRKKKAPRCQSQGGCWIDQAELGEEVQIQKWPPPTISISVSVIRLPLAATGPKGKKSYLEVGNLMVPLGPLRYFSRIFFFPSICKIPWSSEIDFWWAEPCRLLPHCLGISKIMRCYYATTAGPRRKWDEAEREKKDSQGIVGSVVPSLERSLPQYPQGSCCFGRRIE